MSKVLKLAVLEKGNPIKLKEPQNPATTKDSEKALINDLSARKFFEEEGNRLLNEAAAKAREIVEKSKEEAQKIIAMAQTDKENIEKEAFDKGYSDGFEAGKKEQELLWNKYLIELDKTKQELKKQNAVFREHLEKECIRLSLAIAEKILGKAIETDIEYFIDLIKKGLEEAGEDKEALIRISEEDYDRVSTLISKLKGQHSITLLKDPTLSSGDCVIVGPNYEINSGIRTQIENVAEALRKLEVI